MAKLEQKARKGLYGGFKPGSTGGPGTGKLKNTTKRVTANLKRADGDVASNVKDKIENRKTTSTTPIKKEMVHSKILNEYDSPASRLQEQFSGLNQDAMQALVAGGSSPSFPGTIIIPTSSLKIRFSGETKSKEIVAIMLLQPLIS